MRRWETAFKSTTPIDRAGIIGLPPPGIELKPVPVDGRTEIRIRGPNVTPGYWRDREMTRRAFDEDGFLCIGDAAKLADADDPAKGLMFDGRLPENFKLMSGSWVNVGELRWAIVEACAPIVQDVVIAGHDRNEIGILIFLSLQGWRTLGAELAESPDAEALVAHPNEINDKGYLKQRAVLEHRAKLVEKLYAASPDARLKTIARKRGLLQTVTRGTSAHGTAVSVSDLQLLDLAKEAP